MKHQLFLFSFALIAILLQGCKKMPVVDPCSTVSIKIKATPENCKDGCDVVFVAVIEGAQGSDEIAPGSTYEWVYQIEGRAFTAAGSTLSVKFPKPGPYIVELKVSNSIKYCNTPTTSLTYVVSGGGPIANFSMNPENGVCMLTNCGSGTCGINFMNKSENANTYLWTFTEGNGKGPSQTSNAISPDLPSIFNKPDTVLVKLVATKSSTNESATFEQKLIIRPETYVSDVLNFDIANDIQESPFLITQIASAIWMSVSNGRQVITMRANRSMTVPPGNFSNYAGFTIEPMSTSAVKSVPNTNTFFTIATVANAINKPYAWALKYTLAGSELSAIFDTLSWSGAFIEGRGIAEFPASNRLIACGLLKNSSTLSVSGIYFLTLNPNSTSNFQVVNRFKIDGNDLDINYLIPSSDGSFWAAGKLKNPQSNALESCIFQIKADGTALTGNTVFLGTANFRAVKMLEQNKEIIIIGNEGSTNGRIFRISLVAPFTRRYVTPFADWNFKDAVLNDRGSLICIGSKNNQAASLCINASTGLAEKSINFFNGKFSGATRSAATCITSIDKCNMLIGGSVFINGVQNSFFAKTDANGSL